MTRRQMIALIVGGVATLACFALIMALLAFGYVLAGSDRIIVMSVALGPAAMLAVVFGYAVWWMTLFILTLFAKNDTRTGLP